MQYSLGIDLGTTFSAAAVGRPDGVEMVSLGHRVTAIPTVVFVDDDGRLEVGDRAEALGQTRPHLLARDIKRRLGDDTPLILGGRPYSPQALLALVLRTIVARVSAEQGAPPQILVLTHPANWGPYKRELLGDVVRLAGVGSDGSLGIPGGVRLLTEPEAAAIWYAHRQRLDRDGTVAVYDLGGGTFDAAVLARDSGRFRLAGSPSGIEHLGGIDIDFALTGEVCRQVGVTPQALASLPDARARWAAQRVACTAAKEALSETEQTDVAVLVGASPGRLRVCRSTLERLATPLIDQTVSVLSQTIQSASLTPEQVDKVLLVGGTSRLPLVSRRLSEELERPVTVDAHPKNAVALGAAVAGANALAARVVAPRALALVGAPSGALAPSAPPNPMLPAPADFAEPAGPDPASASAAPVSVAPRPFVPASRAGTLRRRRRLALLPAGLAAVAATIGLTLWPTPGGTKVVTDQQLMLEATVPRDWKLLDGGAWSTRNAEGLQQTVGEASLVVGHPDAQIMDSSPAYMLINDHPWLFVGVSQALGLRATAEGMESQLDQLETSWNASPTGNYCARPATQPKATNVRVRIYNNCGSVAITVITEGRLLDDGRFLYVQALASGGDPADTAAAEKLIASVTTSSQHS